MKQLHGGGNKKIAALWEKFSAWYRDGLQPDEEEFASKAESLDESLRAEGWLGGYMARDAEAVAESLGTCFSAIGTGLMIILFCGVVYFMAVLIELAAKGGV